MAMNFEICCQGLVVIVGEWDMGEPGTYARRSDAMDDGANKIRCNWGREASFQCMPNKKSIRGLLTTTSHHLPGGAGDSVL